MEVDSINQAELIRIAENNLNRTIEWINRTDTRFSIILGILTAVMGVIVALASNVKFDNWIPIAATFTIVSLICFLISFIYIIAGSYQRTKSPKKSLIYFGSISELEPDKYIESFGKQSYSQYLDDLLHQGYINSIIVSKKYKYIKRSLGFLLGGILYGIVALAFIVFIS